MAGNGKWTRILSGCISYWRSGWTWGYSSSLCLVYQEVNSLEHFWMFINKMEEWHVWSLKFTKTKSLLSGCTCIVVLYINSKAATWLQWSINPHLLKLYLDVMEYSGNKKYFKRKLRVFKDGWLGVLDELFTKPSSRNDQTLTHTHQKKTNMSLVGTRSTNYKWVYKNITEIGYLSTNQLNIDAKEMCQTSQDPQWQTASLKFYTFTKVYECFSTNVHNV